MPTTEPVDVKKLAGLAEFDSTTLQELMRHASPRRLQPGEILIREGDSVGHCYLVQDGKLRVQVSRGDGSNIILDHVGAGALCGEQALLRPGGKRSATVSAVESTLVLEFEARRIRSAVKKNPHVK